VGADSSVRSRRCVGARRSDQSVPDGPDQAAGNRSGREAEGGFSLLVAGPIVLVPFVTARAQPHFRRSFGARMKDPPKTKKKASFTRLAKHAATS